MSKKLIKIGSKLLVTNKLLSHKPKTAEEGEVFITFTITAEYLAEVENAKITCNGETKYTNQDGKVQFTVLENDTYSYTVEPPSNWETDYDNVNDSVTVSTSDVDEYVELPLSNYKGHEVTINVTVKAIEGTTFDTGDHQLWGEITVGNKDNLVTNFDVVSKFAPSDYNIIEFDPITIPDIPSDYKVFMAGLKLSCPSMYEFYMVFDENHPHEQPEDGHFSQNKNIDLIIGVYAELDTEEDTYTGVGSSTNFTYTYFGRTPEPGDDIHDYEGDDPNVITV